MIDRELLESTVAQALEGTDLFVVDIKVAPQNEITVEIDSRGDMDIDTCMALSRRIEEVFDREVEDYELEVGSAGLTSPLKVYGQYEKNLGNDMEVVTRDGRKLKGVLLAAAPDPAVPGNVLFTLETTVKVKEPGAKRPVQRKEELQLSAADCKSVRYDLKF